MAGWPGWAPGPPAAAPLLSWTGRGNRTKGWWVRIRAGRDRSAITAAGKTDSAWGDQLNLLPIKSDQDNEK